MVKSAQKYSKDPWAEEKKTLKAMKQTSPGEETFPEQLPSTAWTACHSLE